MITWLKRNTCKASRTWHCTAFFNIFCKYHSLQKQSETIDKTAGWKNTTIYKYITLAHVYVILNTLRPRQNGRHFADDTFKRIFANENIRILIEISLKFVPDGPINNIPAFVQIMDWRRPGDKPLSEPIMVCLPTHTCVTRPQWVNITILSYMYCMFWESIISIQKLRYFSTKLYKQSSVNRGK